MDFLFFYSSVLDVALEQAELLQSSYGDDPMRVRKEFFSYFLTSSEASDTIGKIFAGKLMDEKKVRQSALLTKIMLHLMLIIM